MADRLYTDKEGVLEPSTEEETTQVPKGTPISELNHPTGNQCSGVDDHHSSLSPPAIITSAGLGRCTWTPSLTTCSLFLICAPFALFPCRMLSGKFRSRLIPLHFPFALDCCCCCRWHVSQPVSQLANNQLLPARRELIICKGSQMRPAVAVAVAITTTALLTSSPVLSPPTTTLLLLLLLTTVCILSQARHFVQPRQNTWLVGWLVSWLLESPT